MRFLKENKFGWFLIFLIFFLGALSVIYVPHWKGPAILSENYILFSLSFFALILIYWIAGFLFVRWNVTGKKNKTTFLWAWSFIIFSITFVGLLLQSLGISWADSKVPFIFFMFRQSMIFFIIGIYLGVSKILEVSNFWRKIFPAGIFILSYAWFIYGLLFLKNIELTMYAFLSFLFVPVCFLVATFFWRYSIKEKLYSMKIISIGFALMGLTYMAWAPWHLDYFYIIMFFAFVFSLVVILVGFIYLLLTKNIHIEKTKNKSKKRKVKNK